MAAPLQHPEWEWAAKYKNALMEVDDAKLIHKIDEAEEAISTRVQAMDGTAIPEERRALEDAINALRFLRQERLGHRR